MKNQIIDLPIEQLCYLSEPYFMKMCGFHKDLEKNKTHMKESIALRDPWKDQWSPHLILSSYSSDCIQEGSFCFGESRIDCQVLHRIPKEEILRVFVYGMCLEEMEQKKEMDFLESFYLDTWMTALIDAGRDWTGNYIRSILKQSDSRDVFVTDSFGPGFYGIGIEAVSDWMKIIDGEKIGLKLYHGVLNPPKSNVGIYLALSKETALPNKDCSSCLSGRQTCEFCKNYIPE